MYTCCRADDDNDEDSDEEAVRNMQQTRQAQQQQQQQRRGNITSADMSQEGDIVITEAKSKKRITISLQNRDSIVCAVCGQTGHTAGFIGAVYVDCPVKPCYICKQSGHTAATCPFRLDPTLNVAPAANTKPSNLCANMQQREVHSSPPRCECFSCSCGCNRRCCCCIACL